MFYCMSAPGHTGLFKAAESVGNSFSDLASGKASVEFRKLTLASEITTTRTAALKPQEPLESLHGLICSPLFTVITL